MSGQSKPFGLKTMWEIESLRQTFDAAFEAAVKDCQSRPGLNKARTITITVTVKPDKEDPDKVEVKHTCGSKNPPREIPRYRMLTTYTGGAKFQPTVPAEPDQNVLFTGEDLEEDLEEDLDDDDGTHGIEF